MTDLTERQHVAPLEPPDLPINLTTDDQIVPMWKQRLRIFLHNRLAIASVIFLFVTILACFLVPLLHPTNQTNQAATFGLRVERRAVVPSLARHRQFGIRRIGAHLLRR